MLSVRTNPSTLAAGLGAVKNALRKLTDLRVNLAHPMYRESQLCSFFIGLYFNSVLGCQCVLITMCCMPMFEFNVSRYVT